MRKLYLTVAMIALSCTAANAQTFVSSTHNYDRAVVERPVFMQGSSDYSVRNDLVINNNFTMQGSGDVHVGGNLYVQGPMLMQGSGDIVVDGDLVVRNQVTSQGSGDIVVHGKIIIINGQGKLVQQGSGEVEGETIYADDYAPLPLAANPPVIVKEVRRPVRHVTHVYTQRPAAAPTTVIRDGDDTITFGRDGSINMQDGRGY